MTDPKKTPPKPPHVDPYDVLRAFVDAIEAAPPDRVSRTAALRQHRPMGPAYDAVARLAMPEGDPAWVDGEIARLAAIDGMASVSKEFKRGLIARGKAIKKAPHLRMVEPEEAEELDCPFAFTVPAGYSVDASGVYRLVANADGSVVPKRIADGPLLLIGRSKDVESDADHVTLAWRNDHGWTEEIVPREVCAEPRTLVSLSARGAPIIGPRSGDVSAYLSLAEATCGLLQERACPRMGWVETALIVGREVHRPTREPGPEVVFRPEPGSAQLADHYRVAGTWQGWLEAWALVSNYPIAAASVYVACAAPFLDIVGADGFIVDWSARPGSGKTTALRLGSSVWGEPTERALIKSWSSTPTYLERAAWVGCDLPMFLDDTNRVPLAQRDSFSTLIYQLANGNGKGRGTVKGTAPTVNWKTVVLSTGEARMTSYTQEAGAHARVISLTGYPLGAGKDAQGAERSEALRAIVEAHHGHLGAKLARWIVDADRDLIRRRYREIVAGYTSSDQLPNATTRRFSPRVGLLDLVRSILHTQLGVPRPAADPIAEIWRQVQQETEEADMPAEALRYLYQHATAQPSRFWGRHAIDSGGQALPPSAGWLGAWDEGHAWTVIGFMPKDTKTILERGKYASDLILTEWKARGWLVTEAKGLTAKLMMQGDRVRLYVVKRSALVAVGAVDADGRAGGEW